MADAEPAVIESLSNQGAAAAAVESLSNQEGGGAVADDAAAAMANDAAAENNFAGFGGFPYGGFDPSLFNSSAYPHLADDEYTGMPDYSAYDTYDDGWLSERNRDKLLKGLTIALVVFFAISCFRFHLDGIRNSWHRRRAAAVPCATALTSPTRRIRAGETPAHSTSVP